MDILEKVKRVLGKEDGVVKRNGYTCIPAIKRPQPPAPAAMQVCKGCYKK